MERYWARAAQCLLECLYFPTGGPTLNAKRVSIGLATVVMLVVLRLTLGCHFLYEGVWKIRHAEEFSAQPFLTQAKGPLASLFYAMVPDLYGRERLQIEERELEEAGKKVSRLVVPCFVDAWQETLDRFVQFYHMTEDQQAEAQKIFQQYVHTLDTFLRENQKEIAGYFQSLEDFEVRRAKASTSHFEQARIWQEDQKLRGEAAGWIGQIDQIGQNFHLALWNKLDEEQRAKGMVPLAAVGSDQLPVSLLGIQSWSDLLDKTVTYSLTAIGVCLMLGLCTRLAALGGAAFMLMILATQPPWPTIYPPFPEVVGHALVVDKNFIEMIALVLVATTAVGRWAGLDYFLYRWLIEPWCRKKKDTSPEIASPQSLPLKS